VKIDLKYKIDKLAFDSRLRNTHEEYLYEFLIYVSEILHKFIILPGGSMSIEWAFTFRISFGRNCASSVTARAT